MNCSFDYIKDVKSLAAWCDSQKDEVNVAIDTEFERRTTYYPEICLIQVATSKSIVCIDTILCKNVVPLVEFLNESHRTKVLHAARQDLEVLEILGVNLTHSFFDSQIAATVTGENDQIGYGGLTNKLINIELDKNQQQANWKIRPLPARQLRYAASDVQYLLPLYGLLRRKIQSLKRLEWLNEDCRTLVENSKSQPTDFAWKRLKNISSLKTQVRLRACSLANWREQIARELNTPRGWLLRDSDIKTIAIGNPSTESALLGSLRGKEKFCRQHSDGLLSALANAGSLEDIVTFENYLFSENDKKKVKALLKSCEEIANDLDVSSTFLMTTNDSKEIIKGGRPAKFFAGWRLTIFREIFQSLAII